MTSKKILLGAAIIGFVVIAMGVNYIWSNFRGAGPAFQRPPKNIADLIDNARSEDLKPGENKTDFPLTIPEGFTLSVFAHDLGSPRDIEIDPAGTLLVSIPSQGRIVALPDSNNDGVVDSVTPLVSSLDRPHGLALRCPPHDGTDIATCQLYVAETTRLVRYDYTYGSPHVGSPETLLTLPSGGRHVTRSLIFLPEPNTSTLLISIGSSCDVCVEKDSRRGSVLAYDIITKQVRTFASGLRNAVFMASYSQRNEIWSTEMGRDHLGDNLPPDEINILQEGNNYGWPYCYGKNIHDDKFDSRRSKTCAVPEFISSNIDLPAHSAPLGLAFIPQSDKWPEEYRGSPLLSYP